VAAVGVLGGTAAAAPGAVHRMAAHVKIVAVVAFALVVVSTPVRAAWAPAAYAGYLLLVLAAAAAAGVGPRRLVRGLAVEIPFVGFAVLLPFLSGGPRVDVLGLTLSADGLAVGGGILAKATVAVLAATVLSATTGPRELLRGLERLHLPQLLVQILTFMIRYADVVTGELRRMRIARESRGFRGRHLGALRVLGPSAGALFVRSFERGERVHLAMLARGYTGRLPETARPEVPPTQWALALALPASAAAVLAAGLLAG
jgi:cobalt/nickel transport system permease protein